MRAGIIGLGAMGGPIARNLARADILHRIWTRDIAKADVYINELQVKRATTPAQLAAECDLIFTCVSKDEDLIEVVEKLMPGLVSKKVIVDLSTTSVDTAKYVAEQLLTKGVEFLDSPVSGGVEGAAHATLVLMIGGSKAVYEQVKPILELISNKQIHMGKTGDGQATKAVNQIMAAGINQAVTEALAFANALDLNLQQVIEVTSAGAASNWFLKHRGPTLVRENYDTGFKLSLHNKDLEICRKMSESLTIDQKLLPLVEMTRNHYQQLIDSGYGSKDISCLYMLKKELFLEEYRK